MLVLFGVFCGTFEAFAEEAETTIYGYSLDYRLTSSGATQYNLLFDRFREKGLNFHLKIQPLIRTHRSILSDRSACIFPANIATLSRVLGAEFSNESVLVSAPVDIVSAGLFVRSEDQLQPDLSDLQNKKIAYWNGLDIEDITGFPEVKGEPTPNETVRLKMLDAGRVKAIMGFKPDVFIASDILGVRVEEVSSVVAEKFPGRAVSLICYFNKKNELFIQDFNKVISEMKLSGELRGILGKYAQF